MSQEARVRVIRGDSHVNATLRNALPHFHGVGCVEHLRLSFQPETVVTRALVDETMQAMMAIIGAEPGGEEIISYEIEEPV